MSKLSEFREGLIILAACIGGFSQQLFLEGRAEEAEDHILEMKSIFGDDYYLEVQYSGLIEQEEVNDFFYQMSAKHDIKVVITSDSHYVDRDDSDYHNALVNVNIGGSIKKRSDETKSLTDDSDQDQSGMYYTPHEYFIKSVDDLRSSGKLDRFYDGFAISNKIADQCNVDFRTGGKYIPSLSEDEDGELKNMAEEGLHSFMSKADYSLLVSDELISKYWIRLYHELEVISKMEFSGYFLVVSEYVNWAKTNGIMVGGGRGSAAGSLVSFAIGVTSVDPIKYGLLFERFLSRGRAKRPVIEFKDFTIDEYLKNK